MGCLLLEYLRGGTLALHIAKHSTTALSELEVLEMADQVLCALAFMHKDSARLIHRDVKPWAEIISASRKSSNLK